MLDGEDIRNVYGQIQLPLSGLSLSWLIRFAIADELHLYHEKEVGRRNGMIKKDGDTEVIENPDLASIVAAQEEHLVKVYAEIDRREQQYRKYEQGENSR